MLEFRLSGTARVTFHTCQRNPWLNLVCSSWEMRWKRTTHPHLSPWWDLLGKSHDNIRWSNGSALVLSLFPFNYTSRSVVRFSWMTLLMGYIWRIRWRRCRSSCCTCRFRCGTYIPYNYTFTTLDYLTIGGGTYICNYGHETPWLYMYVIQLPCPCWSDEEIIVRSSNHVVILFIIELIIHSLIHETPIQAEQKY